MIFNTLSGSLLLKIKQWNGKPNNLTILPLTEEFMTQKSFMNEKRVSGVDNFKTCCKVFKLDQVIQVAKAVSDLFNIPFHLKGAEEFSVIKSIWEELIKQINKVWFICRRGLELWFYIFKVYILSPFLRNLAICMVSIPIS